MYRFNNFSLNFYLTISKVSFQCLTFLPKRACAIDKGPKIMRAVATSSATSTTITSSTTT